MQIFVRLISKIITLEVEPDDTIETVKLKIQDKEGIEPRKQILRIRMRTILLDNDEKTVSDYGIMKESTLYLDIRNTGIAFTVVYKDNSYTTPDWCPGCNNGRSLKEFMARETGIEMECIELIHDWVIIDEKTSLQEQELNEKSYIQMVLKNVKKVKITCDDKEFDIYCKRPLKLNDIKDLIKKQVKNLKDFDLEFGSTIMDEKEDLNRWGMLNHMTVIRK